DHAALAGLSPRFAIFDRGDSLRAIKNATKAAGFDPKNFEPPKILGAISRQKGEGVTADEFAERASDFFPRVVSRVWDAYEKTLAEEKAVDFDDLLLKTMLLLKNETALRARYQGQWKYLHIDEYQDTNRVQYDIARLLAEGHKNIAVVGDVDQNIYQWRGASIKNMLGFERDWPNAKVVTLEENYRSTQTILDAANRVIEKNKHRLEKTLFTKNAGGEKIGLFAALDEAHEAQFIAEKSRELITNGTPPREIAVLFRANFQSRALEEAFLNADIPYQVVGVRFFERKEVKDIIAYARAALDQTNTGDFARIINVPPRGIGKVTLLKILAKQEGGLTAGTRQKIAAFRGLLARIQKKLETEPLSVALKYILTESGIEKTLKDGDGEDEERLENLRELVSFAMRYDARPRAEALEQFLTDAALASDQDELKEEKNAVRLMTVHSAKGLEFDVVFIAGLEDGLFPHARLYAETQTPEESEEERRLFYVALTRARKKIYLSYAGVRSVFGSRQVNLPSEFIFDIPEELLEDAQM
ncbi:MAG: DNA helicase II / ATP-dependent DNA helicase PcrA, partial [Parcubacteria group bacterium Gr01-1014_17]